MFVSATHERPSTLPTCDLPPKRPRSYPKFSRYPKKSGLSFCDRTLAEYHEEDERGSRHGTACTDDATPRAPVGFYKFERRHRASRRPLADAATPGSAWRQGNFGTEWALSSQFRRFFENGNAFHQFFSEWINGDCYPRYCLVGNCIQYKIRKIIAWMDVPIFMKLSQSSSNRFIMLSSRIEGTRRNRRRNLEKSSRLKNSKSTCICTIDKN